MVGNRIFRLSGRVSSTTPARAALFGIGGCPTLVLAYPGGIIHTAEVGQMSADQIEGKALDCLMIKHKARGDDEKIVRESGSARPGDRCRVRVDFGGVLLDQSDACGQPVGGCRDRVLGGFETGGHQ